jgi:hypothetical protein
VWRWLAAAGALVFGAVGYTFLTIPDVRPLATTNPKTTAFMELRARESERDGKPFSSTSAGCRTRASHPISNGRCWPPRTARSGSTKGIDVEQIRVAVQQALDKGIVPRGASTLTQQLAKNLYLSPSRDPMRKLRELIITRRLEARSRSSASSRSISTWWSGATACGGRKRRRATTSACRRPALSRHRRRSWPARSSTRAATTRAVPDATAAPPAHHPGSHG